MRGKVKKKEPQINKPNNKKLKKIWLRRRRVLDPPVYEFVTLELILQCEILYTIKCLVDELSLNERNYI